MIIARKGIVTFVLILIISLSLMACSVTRQVTMPDGSIYIVKCQKDDFVTLKKEGVEFMVDGRGRPGMIEQALGLMFMNLPDVTVEN